MISEKHISDAETRAKDQLEAIDKARAGAVETGTTPEDAAKIGATAEVVALDVINLAQELRAEGRAYTALGRMVPLVRNMGEIIEAHVEGRELPPEPVLELRKDEVTGAPERAPTAAQLAQMDRSVRRVDPEATAAPPPVVTPEPSTGTPPPAARQRAQETPVDLSTWEPSERDMAALSAAYEEKWIRDQLGAFREEHKGPPPKMGARPRVTFGTWLKGRDGADAARKS